MRATHTVQPSVFQPREVVHPFAAQLEAASGWLDQHPELLAVVASCVGAAHTCGRHGLTSETILRAAVLKQLTGYSYRELAFALLDSASMQRFARVDPFCVPKKSALQGTISAIDTAAWLSINKVLVHDAKRRGVESGRQVRIDSTVTETHILEPSDSRLLYDGVRVLTRLLRDAKQRLAAVSFGDHCRAAKRRAQAIRTARAARRRCGYRKLLRLVAQTLADTTAALVRVRCVTDAWADQWCTEVNAYRDLLTRVVEQTERRVFAGETVPASEKVVSLFEPHTDIIRKGGRATHYGHKLNLSSGRSGLVLDVVVEAGNPADSERCLPMLRRHVEVYGEAPQRVAFDGGYASRANLAGAKALGVEHVVFHKKRGLRRSDMTGSAWVYGEMKRFRAGMEAVISYLKRCYGLDRCNWRGRERFQRYVHAAIFTHNLLRLVSLQLR